MQEGGTAQGPMQEAPTDTGVATCSTEELRPLIDINRLHVPSTQGLSVPGAYPYNSTPSEAQPWQAHPVRREARHGHERWIAVAATLWSIYVFACMVYISVDTIHRDILWHSRFVFSLLFHSTVDVAVHFEKRGIVAVSTDYTRGFHAPTARRTCHQAWVTLLRMFTRFRLL